jgi:hypothetical protein
VVFGKVIVAARSNTYPIHLVACSIELKAHFLDRGLDAFSESLPESIEIRKLPLPMEPRIILKEELHWSDNSIEVLAQAP